MLIRALCLVLAAATLTGCERAGLFKDNSPTFDGQRYRGSVKSDRKNRQDFTVTINQVSKSVAGAVSAGEYKATQHCIQYFGTSDIVWTVGPDSTPLPVTNDTLTLRGSCRDL
jgi:hypothetical protein